MASVLDPSDMNCLICISPCKELSTDLFLYNCQCVYVVHKECFADWRHVSKTNRICIICHEELLPVRVNRPGIIDIHAIENRRYSKCVNFVVIPLLAVGMVLVISIIIQCMLPVQIETPFYKKNNYLLQYNHNEL